MNTPSTFPGPLGERTKGHQVQHLAQPETPTIETPAVTSDEELDVIADAVTR